MVVQHLVPSVVPFARTLLETFRGSTVTFCGKRYSTIPAVQREVEHLIGNRGRVFADVVDLPPISVPVNSLVLDEGGRLMDLLGSAPAAGVEQTSSGNRTTWGFPTVLVCRSAAKLMFESQVIARGILRKLSSLGQLDGRRIGIIGVGALGRELAQRLVETGHDVVVYDKSPVRGWLADLHRPVEELLRSAALILGVTGRDCLQGLELASLEGEKTFASCSSSNREFASLFSSIGAPNGFRTLRGAIGNASVSILNGGFPINFDRRREWELDEEISLTRQLCLEGLLQAEGLAGGRARGVMLDPAIQLKVVEEWLACVPERRNLRIPQHLSIDYFRTHSEGEYIMATKPVYTLHSTTPGALEKMRTHHTPYDSVVCGVPVLVLPGVWSPEYDWSSAFYVENFPDVTGLSFLEIGSGTGVISVHAGLRGASKIVATDVNPEAVRNTRLNFDRHQIENAEVVLSDGFDRVDGRFDVIAWNAPYHGSHPEDLLERGCADEEYRGIRAFFRAIRDHLNPGGSVVFGFSESGDLPLVRSLISGAGFRIKRELSDWRQGYNCMLFELAFAPEDRPNQAAA